MKGAFILGCSVCSIDADVLAASKSCTQSLQKIVLEGQLVCKSHIGIIYAVILQSRF